MRWRDWLFTFGGAAAGVVVGRWLTPARSTPALPPVPPAPPSSDTQPRLTRDDVIRLIETNGGPEGLDLSHYDLSEIKLSRLNLQGVIFSTYRVRGSLNARTTRLVGTVFSHSNLTRAKFDQVNLQNASFWRADLHEASLRGAKAENVNFGRTNLNRANFRATKLDGADFWYANLSGTNLSQAQLSNAILTGVHLDDALIQENIEAYNEYFARWYAADVSDKARAHDIAWRYQDAAEVYMNLKNAFLFNGLSQEASWAFIKERKMRRAMILPWRAKTYYGEATAKKPGFLKWRWVWFYLKYSLLWLVDWLTDLTSGYGERPLRTLWVALAVILSFPLFYGLSGQVRLQTGGVPSGLDYLIYSLGAFSTMDFSRFETTGVIAETLASIEALLGISILALLMFALGNRISRS